MNHWIGYFSDLLQPHVPWRSLRSIDQLLLGVQKSRLKHRGDRAFAVVAPKLWNSLPLHVRLAPILPVFKSCHITHIYSLAFNSLWELLYLLLLLYFTFYKCISFYYIICLLTWCLWFIVLFYGFCYYDCTAQSTAVFKCAL